MTTDSAPQAEHAAPHRARVSTPWLLAGLAIPPGAWIVEMLVGVGIASNACPLTGGAQRAKGFSGEAALLVAITVACLAAAVASGLLSLHHWRQVRHEKQGGEHSHLTLGEGRTRFLALAGGLNAATFAIAILFSLLEPIVIPLCWSAR